MPLDTLTLREINRATLARQMLLARERVTPVAAIERLDRASGAVAATALRRPVELASTDFERAHLAALFDSRTAVRATFIRATIHVADGEATFSRCGRSSSRCSTALCRRF